MNSLRRAVTDFYVYKHSLLGPLLAASGIEQITSAKEAASFCDFIDRYLPLASLCHYSGKPIALPHEGESWESRALQCEAHFQRLWPVYCSNRREIDPQNILRGMDFENHPFLLSLAAFAEAHWIHNNLDTFRSALELIAALDAPRFEKFRQWRYDRTNETIARQLQPLSDLQHPLWQNDYVSPSLPGKDGARLRLLVTDCPALLLFAGETPLHTNSCLIHTGNPDLNGPLLSLMADAHQKMALLLDERSLPTELVDDPSSPLEPHADAIRRACLCRSVIKLAEDTKGAPGIVLSPTYHPAGQRSRQNEAHLQAALLDWSQNSLGIRVFSRPRSGSATETFFVPSSRFPIGQNEDFDGMTWSTAMKGRIALMLSPLG
jgi:hypothetical protein